MIQIIYQEYVIENKCKLDDLYLNLINTSDDVLERLLKI